MINSKMEYDLELERVAEEIKSTDAKNVLLQLPEGLMSQADDIQRFLKKKTTANILFWSESCFGACDIPLDLKTIGIDLLVHFGHCKWKM